MYVEKADGLKRRSAQTACWYILDTLTRLMAPMLSFTAEQVSDHYQKDKKQSIHLQSFALLENLWAELNGMPPLPANTSQAFTMRFIEHVKATHHELAYMQLWQQLLSMRPAVLKTIEKVREQGIVKHSLEVQLTLYWDPATMQAKELILPFFEKLNTQYYTQDLVQFLKEFFIVSQVVIASEKTALDATEYPGLYAQVAHAPGHKCPRCWHWEVNDHPDYLCKRCQEVLKK